MVAGALNVASYFKFGIPDLDGMVANLPKSSSILIVGDPGVGKTFFASQTLAYALRAGGKAVWALTDMAPSDLKDHMERLGCDLSPFEEEGKFNFIDCYSYRAGGLLPKVKFFVDDPTALFSISVAIDRAISEMNGADLLVFDSLSGLIFEADPQPVLKFVRNEVARCRAKGVFSIWLMERGAHEEHVLNSFKALMTGYIEMWFEASDGLERYMRIFKLSGAKHPLERIKFYITPEGIRIT